MSTGVPMTFPALFSFICMGDDTEDGCTIDLGFPLEGTMIRRRSLWISVDAASNPSRITSFGDTCWVYSALECRLSKGISHGCAHIVLSLGRHCDIRESKKTASGSLK